MSTALQQVETLASILPPVRILAIDNKQDELDNLKNGFEAVGIPCVSFLYDPFNGIDKKPYINTSQARFVFIDLNLEDIEFTSKPRIVGHLIKAISQLDVLGPYVLIFWTKHPTEVDAVMRLLKTRVENKFNLPFFFCTMNKLLLKLPDNEDVTFSLKLDALKEEITKIFYNKMVFSSIVSWENKVSEAASSALKILHDHVRQAQESGVAQKEEDFTRLLKMLASSAWGKAAKENWGHSVASGINPFLSDNLDYGISSDDTYGSIWDKALDQGTVSKLPRNVPAHKLNTSCALDTTCKIKEAYGVWLQFKLTISPEFIFIFGDSGRSLIDDFINTKKLIDANVDFEDLVKLGMLDITRACDYANRKHGLRRFVLGAIIPSSIKEYIRWDNDDSPNKKHEGIHKLPDVSFEEADVLKEFVLQVNFRYVFSIPDNSPLLADSVVFPRFRVRKQILTDIISKFGAHTTSPGILSFK